MKTLKPIVLTLTILLAAASLSLAAVQTGRATTPLSRTAESDGSQRATDQIILQYQSASGVQLDGPNQAAEMDYLSSAAGVTLTYVRPMSGDAHVLKLPAAMPEGEVDALAARLAALPGVAYAEPDAILFPTQDDDVQPQFPIAWPVNDPSYSAQWHYFEPGSNHYGINAPAAWEIFTGSATTVVAVIDTGITTHPDLTGRVLSGYDFIADIPTANDGNGRDNNPADPGDWVTSAEASLVGGPFYGCKVLSSSWHGTHVAGTIGALSNNNLGVAGIDWNAKILPVRVMGKCGGYSSDIADGMRWAAGLSVAGVPANTTPAKVLNLSLGAPGNCLTTYQNAIDDILAAGATVVVSAGNENVDASGYRPSNCTGVITVAATDRYGARAPYSNFGSTVEISAPGGNITNTVTSNGILSTINTGSQGPVAADYGYKTGTSMSAPHVTGVVSLLYGRNPNIYPALVLRLLQESATAFPAGSTCSTSKCGAGMVNAGNVLRQPTIISLSHGPLTGAITQTQLTVSGVNFTSSSTILLGGTPLTTTYISAQKLQATLTITDIVSTTPRLVSVRNVFSSGTYTSASMGLYITYLPMITRNYGWNTIFSDDFESGLSASWAVTDNRTSGYTWAASTCKPYQGGRSAWILAGGTKGPAACGSSYVNQMDSSMKYGPFSLKDALAGEIRFNLWVNTETAFDLVCVKVSKDGANFYGDCYSGNSGGWIEKTINLANVSGGLGNVLGQPSVTVKVYFTSGTDTVRAEGVFLDNFSLRQCLGGGCTPLATSASNPPELIQSSSGPIDTP